MKEIINACQHIWNFEITQMKDSNLFVETCLECSQVITTLELFNKENL
jgi:hypothetical protein